VTIPPTFPRHFDTVITHIKHAYQQCKNGIDQYISTIIRSADHNMHILKQRADEYQMLKSTANFFLTIFFSLTVPQLSVNSLTFLQQLPNSLTFQDFLDDRWSPNIHHVRDVPECGQTKTAYARERPTTYSCSKIQFQLFLQTFLLNLHVPAVRCHSVCKTGNCQNTTCHVPHRHIIAGSNKSCTVWESGWNAARLLWRRRQTSASSDTTGHAPVSEMAMLQKYNKLNS